VGWGVEWGYGEGGVGSIADWMRNMRSCLSHRRSENDHSSLVDELGIP